MTAREAVCQRIIQLCKVQRITMYTLAKRSAIGTSTVDNIVNRNVDPSTATICKISNGFGMTLKEFYDDEIFCVCEEE